MGMTDMLEKWAAGTISVAFAPGPGEGLPFGSMPSRYRFGKWVRDNVAASLVDDPMLPNGIAAAAFAEELMPQPGSIAGIWAQLSEAPAGSDLTISATIDGVPSTDSVLVAPDGGGLDQKILFPVPLDTYLADQKIGLALTTGGGWTATTLDLAAGFVIIDG